MNIEGNSTYRADIDGLRAVAILAVVLYHAGVPGFTGGFVGVDVFFVISGFLIIGLLCREFERDGDLSLVGFYERRIRRLAPALVLVLAVTLLLGAFLLTPVGGEQQGLAKSTLATLALVSNLYFAANTGGYFDGPSELQPLLHTWSLSVEEQFYLFWPWVVLLAGRHALRRQRAASPAIARALLLLLLLSLTSSVLCTPVRPVAAFYAAPARAWEFAVGGLVFFALERDRWCGGQTVGDLVAALGLAGIAAAVFVFDVGSAFPGHLALLPVLGASAVILGVGWTPQGLVARLLTLRGMVWIGLTSYSWYLWHWPLLAIARVHMLGELNWPVAAGISALALLLAVLSFTFVEQPIRHRRIALMSSRRRTYGFGAAGVAATAALAIVLGAVAKFVWSRAPGQAALIAAMADLRKVRIACWQERPYSGQLRSDADCDLPVDAGAPRLLIWGDSHASHLMPMAELFAQEHGGSVRIRFMPECPPLQDYSPRLIGVSRSPGCEQFNRDVLDEIQRLHGDALQGVVLVARWPAYVSNAEARQAASRGLQATVSALQRIGVRTLLVEPIPELPHEAPACLIRRAATDCGVPRAEAEGHRIDALSVFDAATGGRDELRRIDPLPQLCSSAYCPAMRQGTVLFSDRHHLSERGSLALLPGFRPALAWATTAAPSISAETPPISH